MVKKEYWRRCSLLICLLALGASPISGLAGGPQAPLLIRNSFSTPEEALNHFLRRDESGAFWAGMLDPERRAFTTWTHPPQSETFLRLRSRTIGVTRRISTDEVAIPVTVILAGHQDSFGTQMPTRERGNKLQQVFRMKRLAGQWKIIQPQAEEFVPAIKAGAP